MSTSDNIERYLHKHAEDIEEERKFPQPRKNLRLCIVIPALAERENIGLVLDSLKHGSKRLDCAEVIVVVNNSTDAFDQIVQNNLKTIEELGNRDGDRLPILVLDRASAAKALGISTAGVGAARRAGMDLALRRLVKVGQLNRSAIACLDADSPVASGYIDALLSVFDAPDRPIVALCSYRHPIPEDQAQARAIVAYELWLRYIELGLLLSRSLCAFQTVGSCIVTSPEGYALADGMPRAKAGEDFYFLQKVAKVGGPESVFEMRDAIVHPSARVSDRVPFGTGRAMLRCRDEGVGIYLYAEPLQAFRDMRKFFQVTSESFENFDRLSKDIEPRLARFIERKNGWSVLDGLRKNSCDAEHFTRAANEWFDSLQVVRYARQSKEEQEAVWIFESITQALTDLGREELISGLNVPDQANPEFSLQVEWLERLRSR
ncbi:MAG: glycosyltransferase [Deltaproteobacteria bacterium]|nr:glycosyltransferase [Deltaproteobacteria bacterium]